MLGFKQNPIKTYGVRIVKKTLAYALFALLLLCTISTKAEEVQSDLSQSYINKASNLFMKKNITGAIECLNEAITTNPANPLLYLNRGFINHVVHNYDAAMSDYNSAIKVNPNFEYAYNNRGALKVSLNDIKGALADYQTALNINNNYSDVYYNRGNLKYMLDDLSGALEDYNKAIELNPKDSEAYNNRGVVKKRLNYNVGALSDYSQAISINPKDSIAYANRGRLKKLYFDNEGAAIDLNQAVELAENQMFIKNVKPLLSNQSYIAAIPTVASFAYDFTENDNYSVGKNSESSKHERSVSQNEKIAMAAPGTVNKIDAQNVKDKPVQKILEPKAGTPGKETKGLLKAGKQSSTNNSSTPTLNAGVGKVETPNIPDIRTTAITTNATTNVKLAESYYIRGLQKCVLRDLEGAIADLDKAIANNSKYADAYFYRAAIKKELGDKEGFRKDYSTAIQINPSLQTFNDSNALSVI